MKTILSYIKEQEEDRKDFQLNLSFASEEELKQLEDIDNISVDGVLVTIHAQHGDMTVIQNGVDIIKNILNTYSVNRASDEKLAQHLRSCENTLKAMEDYVNSKEESDEHPVEESISEIHKVRYCFEAPIGSGIKVDVLVDIDDQEEFEQWLSDMEYNNIAHICGGSFGEL